MADIKEFALPEFLKDQSETEIHKEMLEMLKTYVPDMDLTEGSIAGILPGRRPRKRP